MAWLVTGAMQTASLSINKHLKRMYEKCLDPTIIFPSHSHNFILTTCPKWWMPLLLCLQVVGTSMRYLHKKYKNEMMYEIWMFLSVHPICLLPSPSGYWIIYNILSLFTGRGNWRKSYNSPKSHHSHRQPDGLCQELLLVGLFGHGQDDLRR